MNLFSGNIIHNTVRQTDKKPKQFYGGVYIPTFIGTVSNYILKYNNEYEFSA